MIRKIEMKALFALTVAVCVVAASTAQAARVAVTTNGNVASVYLKAAKGAENGGDLNGDFDTIDFLFTANAPTTLTNLSSGAGKPAGEAFTYRNRILDADPLDGGLGFSVVGQTINAQGAAWAGGPLGATIQTGAADSTGLFLQNFNFSGPANKLSGAGRVQLISAGTVVAEIPIVIPEPGSMMLGGSALLGLVGLVRRRIA
jgi:hypothetical protein